MHLPTWKIEDVTKRITLDKDFTPKKTSKSQCRKLKDKSDHLDLTYFLERERPKNITSISTNKLFKKYPEYKDRRGRTCPEEIILYWERRFFIDWGEPECFGCRKWSGVSGVVFSCWDLHNLERAHIIGAAQGGSSQAWNIMYLCPWCHQTMDEIFKGNPNEYKTMVKWIFERRTKLVENVTKKVRENKWMNLHKKKFKHTDTSLDIYKIAESKECRNYMLETFGVMYQCNWILMNYYKMEFAVKKMLQK